MDVEPHQIVTVSRRPPVGMDKPRTLADYQADLVRRFGRVPSWPELAKHEVRAMLKLKDPASTEVSENARSMLPDARKAKGEETIKFFVSLVSAPMTTDDVVTATGVGRSSADRVLNAAADRGLLRKRKVKNVNVWEPLDAPPAEPEPKGVSPEPIVVTVRGVEYASLRACARHFGISVQAVHHAVKNGKADGIGMRQRVAQ